MDAGVEEYWIADPETETIVSIRNDRVDVVKHSDLA